LGASFEDRPAVEQNPGGAITISVVTVFFVLVSLVAFFSLVPKQDNLEFRPISQAMITSFTAIVGIVIPSYFGASAYIHINEHRTLLRSYDAFVA
jgi:asparagine N-glycosylation enzyme membrane subunit Stt3